MESSKLLLIAVLYLLGSPIAYAGDSVVCTAGGGQCTGTLKCVTLGADSVCVDQCTVADVATQCGTGATCGDVTDLDGATVKICATAKGCLTDTECKTADATKPICNLYTLQCEAAAVATTTTVASDTTVIDTTTPTTTTTIKQVIITSPPCVDKVVGGPNDCSALASYCTNELYVDLMKEKCPKTCGYCFNNGNLSGSLGTSTCRNALSDCVNKAYLCKSSIYRNFMKTNCAATCGYC
ncbi:ShKT domain-containing protein [Strongyloides ratti]|uniref:ShKT domain-containing protein n=1 Tax=Strongyloides ratti TaxID=34506 RepID=A0A090LPM7_STRRB|nr:ShKT domain-containing protein [Strongyloides ratti]CEF70139.1 ShKT domain-containing protein [Strongyloides ratti]